MNTIQPGDTVECIEQIHSFPGVLGQTYVVEKVKSFGTAAGDCLYLEGERAPVFAGRFKAVNRE